MKRSQPQQQPTQASDSTQENKVFVMQTSDTLTPEEKRIVEERAKLAGQARWRLPGVAKEQQLDTDNNTRKLKIVEDYSPSAAAQTSLDCRRSFNMKKPVDDPDADVDMEVNKRTSDAQKSDLAKSAQKKHQASQSLKAKQKHFSASVKK